MLDDYEPSTPIAIRRTYSPDGPRFVLGALGVPTVAVAAGKQLGAARLALGVLELALERRHVRLYEGSGASHARLLTLHPASACRPITRARRSSASITTRITSLHGTYAEADNYLPNANVDDGSCELPEGEVDCPFDTDGNGLVGSADLLEFLAAYSYPCP